jgi:hypothetical protein
MTMVIRAVLFVWLALCSGCATQQIDTVLQNLDKDCIRRYSGSVGGMVGSFSFDISCQPSGTTTTTTTTVVPTHPAVTPTGG